MIPNDYLQKQTTKVHHQPPPSPFSMQNPTQPASGLALVRYVQLNRQCSEATAYQRIATFVKQHVPSDDASSIGRMVTHDRQSLLEIAQGLLVQDPEVIDKI